MVEKYDLKKYLINDLNKFLLYNIYINVQNPRKRNKTKYQ